MNSPTEPSGQQPIHPRVLENVLAKGQKIRSFPINQHAIVLEYHWRSESSYTPPGCLVSQLGGSFVFLYAWIFNKVKSLISFFFFFLSRIIIILDGLTNITSSSVNCFKYGSMCLKIRTYYIKFRKHNFM